MYVTAEVLANLDRNMWPVLALCGFAMVCNYAWFFAAVRQGFRDQVVPVPTFCVLFWLAGDGSMVLRYDLWFNVIDHWYVKLFWLALVFTVLTELVFLYMILRFGRKEMAPTLGQRQFTAALLLGMLVMAVAWETVKRLIGDELYIDYFHLANLAGPAFAAAMLLRRGNRAGTTPFIWYAYTAMVASWFTACALWYGAPFATAPYLVLYAVCTLAATAVALLVRRLPSADALAARGAA